MANHLKVAKVLSIKTLHQQGWSQRRIARELGVSRKAVARHLQAIAKEAKAPPGSADPKGTKVPPGSDGRTAESKEAKAPPGSRSLCVILHDVILQKLELGLSAKRIHQDLIDEHQFKGEYSSVKRYVAKLGKADPLPFRRLELPPGEEAQIDFGTGAPVIGPDGKRRRTHVIRVVLSYSRKAYSEVVYRQTTDDFIQCLEHAFEHFGGVPKRLVPDNLKAAVIKADWYDPDLNPKLQSFCEHYGTVLMPTKPRTPRHKGKVERGVAYVQDNALKGRRFSSLQEQNSHLKQWEASIADTRIHGTTKRQVASAFSEEKPLLQELPAERFPSFHEGKRIVSRDGHITVAKSYYSLPPEYLGREVWARWDASVVRIYTESMQRICLHARAEPGRYSTHQGHLASAKICSIERGTDWLLRKIQLIGPHSHAWGVGAVGSRGIQAVRVLQGLLQLSRKHRAESLEAACETAHGYGEYRLATVRRLLKHQGKKQQAFDFLEDHPIIRNLADYGDFVRVQFGKEAN